MDGIARRIARFMEVKAVMTERNLRVCVEMDLSEEWRAISAFPGYEVSDHGRIRWHGWRLRKAVIDAKGYPRVSFWINGKSRQIYVHKLVAEAFLGPRPEGMVVRHGPLGNMIPALANLKYGTPVENEADKAEHGTKVVGMRHHSNKLTEDQVKEIRRRHIPRDPVHGLNAIARELNVSVKTVQAIVLRKIWKHI
jgi:hypothetical protein